MSSSKSLNLILSQLRSGELDAQFACALIVEIVSVDVEKARREVRLRRGAK